MFNNYTASVKEKNPFRVQLDSRVISFWNMYHEWKDMKDAKRIRDTELKEFKIN